MPAALAPMKGFKFGADPELFVTNANGDFVSASDFIPGSKEEPYKVPCGAVQPDGVAAEFNIDPAESYEEFSHNIDTVMDELKKFLPKGHKLAVVSSASFKPEIWEDIQPKARELGCSPDTNAWTGDYNPVPHYDADPRMRCAGGHLHIGFPGVDDADVTDLQHIMNCRDLVKQMDWFLGGWSLQHDTDVIRRNLYGKAGACRYKPYGVEYRTLSNFWLKDKNLRLQTWNRMVSSIQHMRSYCIPNRVKASSFTFDAHAKLVESINTSKRDETLEVYFKFPLTSLSTDYASF
jgi:hypothetical protein